MLSLLKWKFLVGMFGSFSSKWERDIHVRCFCFHSYRSLCFSVYFGRRYFRLSPSGYGFHLRHGEVWFISGSALGWPETESRATNSQRTTALETGTQWQQMNSFSFSASLCMKLKGEELFFKNTLFKFWGNVAGLSGLQVLKSIVFLIVMALKSFPQISISNLLQSVSITVIKISTGIKTPIWVIIW